MQGEDGNIRSMVHFGVPTLIPKVVFSRTKTSRESLLSSLELEEI